MPLDNRLMSGQPTNRKPALTVTAYTSASVAAIAPELNRAIVENFSTFYGVTAGGLYESAEIFVPRRDPRGAWTIGPKQRIAIYDGVHIVWEGEIVDIGDDYEGDRRGNTLRCVGYWGSLLGGQFLDKPWADNRISEFRQTSGFQVSKFDYDSREFNRLRALPKDGVSYVDGDKVEFGFYQCPTGETAKVILFNFDLQEGAQAWKIALWNNTSASDEWTSASSGSGAVSLTLGTPDDNPGFYYVSQAAQTGIGSGSHYGQFSNITIFTEVSNINSTEIAVDIIGYNSGLNSSSMLIGSNTLSLIPFVTNGPKTHAEILNRVASYGDSSGCAWNFYLEASDRSPSPDGRPILVYEQVPSLSDCDFVISARNDSNVTVPAIIRTDYESNWVIVRYRDELNNRDVIVTPDDDSTLKKSLLVTDDGERHAIFDAGVATAATAASLGRQFLNSKSKPQYRMSGPIEVWGTIRTKAGGRIPVTRVRAGQRVRVLDYIDDLSNQTGGGLTFLITGTRVEDRGRKVSITTGAGTSDDLAVVLAQRGLTAENKF